MSVSSLINEVSDAVRVAITQRAAGSATMLLLPYLLLIVASLSLSLGASLTPVTNFGTNPTNVGMYIYVPTNLKTNPAIVVALHYCTGTAQAYFQGTKYSSLADQKGFIVIYPNAPDSGGCWDVHSNNTLVHDKGGDSLGIASMVRYTINRYSANAKQVFATGTSSGAMMTEVLAGAYPDLFAAGAAFAGVPYSCFAGASMWNSDCATGRSIFTAQQWGDRVRSGYPGYTGPRPKIQLWHGTQDTTLYYQNFVEALKQWSNVLEVSFSRNNTNNPISGYTQVVYGDGSKLVGYSAQGVPHNIPVRETDVLAWFGL